MKSIANQYRDLKEGRMSQQNFMRNLRMTMPQYVTNTTSFGDAVRILKNKSIIVETTVKEDFDFTKSAIESAADDKISHTEYDDYDQPIYWSTKNPNVNYYIGSDEQIIKYDGETGERYVIGDLRNYDEPNDYEPDTDADYEEPRDDFDMAGDYNDGEFWEGKENDPEKEWDEEEEEETDDREYDEDEIFNPAYMEEGEDEDAMYDEMIKKIEDELAAREAANAQYDLGEELNEFGGAGDSSDDPKLQAAAKYLVQNRDKYITPNYFTSQGIKLLSLKSDEELYDYIVNDMHSDAVYDVVADMKSQMEESLNEAKKPNVEKAEDENLEEVTLGIFMEHACFPDKSYEEIEKIVKKNIKKNPNYYTNYKLTGIRDYELETMDASKPETHQMKFYTEKDAVDTARGMQKVKMPKKDEKKKLKESKVRTDMKGQIVQAVNSDNVTFSKNDEAKAIDNGEIIKITGFKEEQGKVKALFNKGMFASAIDIDGLEKVVSASPIAQALTKKEIEELMREVMNEYYDGRDNLVDPLAAEEENN